MTEIRFVEAVDASTFRQTADGYMVADVRCARTGCQVYRASELGLVGDHMVTVYRPEESVFAKDSLSTYAHRPITVEHPPVMVDATNWRRYASGVTGDEVVRDGDFVRVPLLVMDNDAIDAVSKGKKEISMGYTTEVEMADGVAPDGTPYQAIQRNIRINHLALVDRARGGNQLRVGDGANTWGAAPTHHKENQPMPDPNMVSVVLGDKAVSVSASDAAAVEAWKSATNDSHSAALADKDKQLADKDAQLADKDTKLAAKDAEIEDLKGKQLTDEALDQRVAARAKLLDSAARIAPKLDTTGLTDAAIRREAVKVVTGDGYDESWTDTYIAARFDLTVDAAPAAKPSDPFVAAHKARDKAPATPTVDHGQSEYETRLTAAWKGNNQKDAH